MSRTANEVEGPRVPVNRRRPESISHPYLSERRTGQHPVWYSDVIINNVLRDKNLVPLSRQHQHALALCVRINRARLSRAAELQAWQAEIQQHFDQEIRYHFDAEEKHLFPAARNFPELEALVDDLIAEHVTLRDYFARATAGALDASGVRSFAETLSSHIRKEERQLFEGMQERMGPGALAQIGAKIDETLAAVSQACIVPAESKLKQQEEPSS